MKFGSSASPIVSDASEARVFLNFGHSRWFFYCFGVCRYRLWGYRWSILGDTSGALVRFGRADVWYLALGRCCLSRINVRRGLRRCKDQLGSTKIDCQSMTWRYECIGEINRMIEQEVTDELATHPYGECIRI